MPSADRPLPAQDTQAYRLLELVAISGEFPANQLRRLPGGESYKANLLKALKRDKLLRTYYQDRLRGYRLTARAKALLLGENDARFAFYLTGRTETNMLKSEVVRRLRLHRIAEVWVTMRNAGVAIFQDEKPDVFYPQGSGPGPPLTLENPAFYSSREVKELDAKAVKIHGARMVGALLTPDSVFAVYNTGGAAMKWNYKSELRSKVLLKTVLCQQRLAHQYHMADVRGLIFGDGMEMAGQLMAGKGEARRGYFMLDGSYDSFCYLTSDHPGEVILKLLCDPEKRMALNELLSSDLNAKEPGWLVENDAIDQDGDPVLFAYDFDMPRIVRFTTALGLHGKRGTILCFDFQADVLRRYCGERVRFQTIGFEKFEGRFFS